MSAVLWQRRTVEIFTVCPPGSQPSFSCHQSGANFHWLHSPFSFPSPPSMSPLSPSTYLVVFVTPAHGQLCPFDFPAPAPSHFPPPSFFISISFPYSFVSSNLSWCFCGSSSRTALCIRQLLAKSRIRLNFPKFLFEAPGNPGQQDDQIRAG